MATSTADAGRYGSPDPVYFEAACIIIGIVIGVIMVLVARWLLSLTMSASLYEQYFVPAVGAQKASRGQSDTARRRVHGLKSPVAGDI